MSGTGSRPGGRSWRMSPGTLAYPTRQSRACSTTTRMSARNRASVLAAIRDLGYRPNAAARTLVTGRTNVLGVISFDTTLYGPASMLYGIERAAHPAYSVAICSLPGFDRRSLPEAVERFLGQAVDGIIVIAPETRRSTPSPSWPPASRWSRWDAGPARRCPRWLSTTVRGGAGDPAPARPGPRDGAPCRRPGQLAGRPGAGRRLAVRPAGRPAPQSRTCCAVTGRRARATRSATGWPAMPEVTAVLCGTIRWRSACSARWPSSGRRVPGDVSVVGFDDVPEAAFFLPPLTTVRQDFGELGRRALHLLLDRISGAEPADVCRSSPNWSCGLVRRRGSRGPPRHRCARRPPRPLASRRGSLLDRRGSQPTPQQVSPRRVHVRHNDRCER